MAQQQQHQQQRQQYKQTTKNMQAASCQLRVAPNVKRIHNPHTHSHSHPHSHPKQIHIQTQNQSERQNKYKNIVEAAAAAGGVFPGKSQQEPEQQQQHQRHPHDSQQLTQPPLQCRLPLSLSPSLSTPVSYQLALLVSHFKKLTRASLQIAVNCVAFVVIGVRCSLLHLRVSTPSVSASSASSASASASSPPCVRVCAVRCQRQISSPNQVSTTALNSLSLLWNCLRLHLHPWH